MNSGWGNAITAMIDVLPAFMPLILKYNLRRTGRWIISKHANQAKDGMQFFAN